MDQLLAIRAFARVVEAGNFTRAANSLDMPNATLSKLVQELEAHLGVQFDELTFAASVMEWIGQEPAHAAELHR